MSTLKRLFQQRDRACRLTPDRALRTLDDAEGFLRERALMTLTPSCSLPSLFEACQEEPYDASKAGFAQWPKTKWWWGTALASREDVYPLKIHRGKTLYLSEEAARLADPICRAELERIESEDPASARLLRHLAAAGPSQLADVQTELGLEPRELKRLRYPLERCGAVVSRPLSLESDRGGHVHTSQLARWDQVFPEPVPGEPELGPLVVAGVRAAVLVPADEPRRWFSWSWRWEDDLVERMLADGKLELVEAGWLCAP